MSTYNELGAQMLVPPVYSDALFAAVYSELKRLAFRRLKRLPQGQSLQATVLVHEAYLKIIKCKGELPHGSWNSSSDFFAAASEAMRRILIDHYRKKRSLKRGGKYTRLPEDPVNLPATDSSVDVLELEEVLREFEDAYPEKAKIVKLRYFVGMTMPECAEALGISLSTVERSWRFARAWLADKLEHSRS